MNTTPLSPGTGQNGAAPATTDILAGTAYRSIRRIGRGGMGEVFEAEHVALGKRVVVKLLRPELSGESSLVERLRIEAQAMAKLDHPNIAAVHDLGTTKAGRPYFVLDYLSGRTLGEELKARGPLPLREAIAIVLDVLDGLGAAHAAGLVHRDVKPPNVFLCDPDRRGRRAVKLLDFGVVKVSPARVPRSFPTEQGHFIGTPATTAPEQARGEAVDARADLYATGLLLYTLVAGKSPFVAAAAGTQSALLAQILTVPERLSSAAPCPVPAPLDALVARALAKQRDDRYATAAQMAAALERVLAELPETTRGPAARGRAARDFSSNGTLVIHAAAAASAPVAPPPRDPGPASARPERARAVLRRILPAALIALATGTLFFALLRLAWRMLRAAP